MSRYVINFKSTGACYVNIANIVKDWDDRRWALTEWRDRDSGESKFRVIKKDLRSREICRLKVTITKDQARSLINRMNLKEINVFSASSFEWVSQEKYDQLTK